MKYWYIFYALSATDMDIIEAIQHRDIELTTYYHTQAECIDAIEVLDTMHQRWPALTHNYIIPTMDELFPTSTYTFCQQDDSGEDYNSDVAEGEQE